MRFVVLLLLVAVLAGLAQALATDVAAELLPAHAGTPPVAQGYKLTQHSSDHATLELHGLRRPLRSGEITLLWIPYSTADPVRVPFRRAGPPRRNQTFDLQLQVPPGTYKLVLPDTRPFGLLRIGRR